MPSTRTSTPPGLGVGEDVGQGRQPHAGPLRDGEAAPGQQRTDLMDCAGDGRPGHPVQLGQRRVRQLQPQVDQGDQHPVDEDQLVIGPGTSCPLTVAAPTFPERGLALRRPRVGQLLDQIAEMCTIKAAEGRMG